MQRRRASGRRSGAQRRRQLGGRHGARHRQGDSQLALLLQQPLGTDQSQADKLAVAVDAVPLEVQVAERPELAAGHREAARLLDPILAGEVTTGTWDPTRRRWTASARSA